MNRPLPFILLPLLLFLGLSTASAQQRVGFQRQKFDRSRFDNAGQADAAPASPAPTGLAAPDAPMAPAPMPTERTFARDADAESHPTSIFSADATLPPHPAGGSPYAADSSPEEKAVIDAPLFDQLPMKGFNNAKDYEELVALQKKIGVCMILYFKNLSVPNEKGLCNWFEKSVTTDIKWRRAMKHYLQLEINVPGNSAVRELVAQYRAAKTPAVFVIKPGSRMPTRLKLFDYPAGSRPVPIEAGLILDELKAGSTPAYQTLF